VCCKLEPRSSSAPQPARSYRSCCSRTTASSGWSSWWCRSRHSGSPPQSRSRRSTVRSFVPAPDQREVPRARLGHAAASTLGAGATPVAPAEMVTQRFPTLNRAARPAGPGRSTKRSSTRSRRLKFAGDRQAGRLTAAPALAEHQLHSDLDLVMCKVRVRVPSLPLRKALQSGLLAAELTLDLRSVRPRFPKPRAVVRFGPGALSAEYPDWPARRAVARRASAAATTGVKSLSLRVTSGGRGSSCPASRRAAPTGSGRPAPRCA
jgi:hypothetical protein